MEKKTHRSPAKQISFLVEIASVVPSEKELIKQEIINSKDDYERKDDATKKEIEKNLNLGKLNWSKRK